MVLTFSWSKLVDAETMKTGWTSLVSGAAGKVGLGEGPALRHRGLELAS